MFLQIEQRRSQSIKQIQTTWKLGFQKPHKDLLGTEVKVFIKTLASGIDFLGWVHFPTHRVLRTATKRRMFKNIKTKENNENTIASYLGMLQHGNARKLESQIKNVLYLQ